MLSKSLSENKLIRKNPNISNEDFKIWTQQNHFRTIYRDMHKKSEIRVKKYAIPGFTGHIPGAFSDGNFGKSYTQTSKEQLNRAKYLPKQRTRKFPNSSLSSIETIGKFGGGIPDEYHSISRLHGKATIPETHPSFSSHSWVTTYAQSWAKIKTKLFSHNDHGKTNTKNTLSGFKANSSLFDGHGWINQTYSNGKNTEYRKHFNCNASFHPVPPPPNLRKLPGRKMHKSLN